jgi:hypothetical protein
MRPAEQVNLWRTEHPKFPQYYGNGSGRDTFIGFSNGGFLNHNCNTMPSNGVQISPHRIPHLTKSPPA